MSDLSPLSMRMQRAKQCFVVAWSFYFISLGIPAVGTPSGGSDAIPGLGVPLVAIPGIVFVVLGGINSKAGNLYPGVDNSSLVLWGILGLLGNVGIFTS